jgi:type IV pilus assembly protein PilV
MIAVFVLAIGLLGLAGLQLTSMQNGHSAFLRSQATLGAYSIIDDMRANQANKANYAVALGATASSSTGLAQQDVDAWLASLAAELPAGIGSVAVNGDRVTVSVQWSDRGTQGSTQTFTMVTDI